MLEAPRSKREGLTTMPTLSFIVSSTECSLGNTDTDVCLCKRGTVAPAASNRKKLILIDYIVNKSSVLHLLRSIFNFSDGFSFTKDEVVACISMWFSKWAQLKLLPLEIQRKRKHVVTTLVFSLAITTWCTYKLLDDGSPIEAFLSKIQGDFYHT